jgi:3-polyprenyl-4-hydroxybenzoate decarboxylase
MIQRTITLAMTGASGAQYGLRLLQYQGNTRCFKRYCWFSLAGPGFGSQVGT